ncbi:MAG: phosphoribosylformylglycinamidine synthase I, partial [Chitinophagaceae bacterium]
KVLGVCNGFQILCEAGLLPGALLLNENQNFICKNVYIKSENKLAAISKNCFQKTLKIPIAHGEGRYYANEETLNQLESNNQIIFKYCDEDGLIGHETPNGSTNHIAGICNTNRNVFGMMPHPERACSSELGNMDGQEIFKSLILN